MGDRLEERKDFSEDVKVKVPQATQLAKSGKLSEGLELLMGLERNCRVGNDFPNLKEVILTMVRLCHEAKDWEQLNTTATLISKRRGQHSKSITAMVEECIPWLDETPDKATKVAMLVALRDITDGKIFVEAQRAKLTRILADIKEKDGDINGATEVMQEVHVETYGALDKKEKADFILEQVRLTLAKKDYVRALIQSRKINRKVMLHEDMQELKVRFYKLMIEYNTHEKDPWELCQDYHSIYDTAIVKADEAVWQDALKSCVLFLVLSAYTNHQQDMLHRVAKYTELEKLPVYKDLLRQFTTPEIIGYPLPQQQELEGHPCLAEGGPQLLAKWKGDFHMRIVQHNIRVASGYYKQISMKRLAQLLGLDEDATESHMSEMVSEGSLHARINRPAGVVSFVCAKPSEEILSEWNSDICTLLQLVETTAHLISKEVATA
ncbi:unnamed protein product [Chrysoparadoxa australica]